MTTTKINRKLNAELFREIDNIRKEVKIKSGYIEIKEIDTKLAEINLILDELKTRKTYILKKNKYAMKDLRVLR